MSYKLMVSDAAWQLVGRLLSAALGLLVIKMISPYLGLQRFGDYKTILDYFAIWGALADFGLYVIALRTLGGINEGEGDQQVVLEREYGRFVFSRLVTIGGVYVLALSLVYVLMGVMSLVSPDFVVNPYLWRGLPVGMLFSASFMVAGIVQLPLQLFWQMKQVTMALVGARVVQVGFLALLLFVLFPKATMSGELPVVVFVLVLVSVWLSGMFQGLFVWWKSRAFLQLRLVRDRSYTRGLLKQNWQYGLAYFLSSFHTLFVILLLAFFFPTIEGYDYAGVWGFALTFMTILIIIPATLGNSMIHKIGQADAEAKRSSLGHFLSLMVWVGGSIVVFVTGFADQIVYFLGSREFVGSGWEMIGSNTLMPWLAVILLGSFIKQTFNYVFVAHDEQDVLLWVNLFGVAVGLPIAVRLVREYALVGGLFAQGLLELLFVTGAVFFAWKKGVLPCVPWKKLLLVMLLCGVGLLGAVWVDGVVAYDNFWLSLLWGVGFAGVYGLLSWRVVRGVMRGLSKN